jgi:putative hydrolase of the HAD superfamily
MVHNVILDFGNVLGMFDKHLACERLATYSEDFTSAQIYEMFVGSEFEKSLECGYIDNRTFAEQFVTMIHAKDLSSEKCLELWGDKFTQNPGMVALLRDIRGRAVPLAVLSTTNAVDWPYVRKLEVTQLLESWNTPFILSYEYGAIKPEAKLYTAALSALNSTPQDAVYVDDIQENVDAAVKLGMTGIVYNCTKHPLDFLQGSLNAILPDPIR